MLDKKYIVPVPDSNMNFNSKYRITTFGRDALFNYQNHLITRFIAITALIVSIVSLML
jgi:hypothetical protein